jgi:uncharacterized protein DUF6883
MKLPNAENAVVEMTKIRDYCLSTTHFRGKNKARVFQSIFGFTVDDAFEFQALLKKAAKEGDAVQGASDSFGTRYIIDFELSRNNRTARIRSCWMLPKNEAPPRFLTCYVL